MHNIKHKVINALEYAQYRKHARANKRMRDILAKRKVEHMFNHPRSRA